MPTSTRQNAPFFTEVLGEFVGFQWGDVLNRPLRVGWEVFRRKCVTKFCNVPNFSVLFPV